MLTGNWMARHDLSCWLGVKPQHKQINQISLVLLTSHCSILSVTPDCYGVPIMKAVRRTEIHWITLLVNTKRIDSRINKKTVKIIRVYFFLAHLKCELIVRQAAVVRQHFQMTSPRKPWSRFFPYFTYSIYRWRERIIVFLFQSDKNSRCYSNL